MMLIFDVLLIFLLQKKIIKIKRNWSSLPILLINTTDNRDFLIIKLIDIRSRTKIE